MKAIFVLVVAGVALLAVALLWRMTFIDHFDNGAMVLLSEQAKECREGGGCAAFSAREIQAISNHAAGVGYEYGVQQCLRDGKT